MALKLNLMVAVCENMGIGKNNNLPWNLRSEMEYFTHMTSSRKSQHKKNVVLMGRKTWDSIPPKFKPLKARINFVLSRSEISLDDYKDTYSFKSLENALEKLNDEQFKRQYEKIWVIGGSHIYKETLHHKNFYRLYLTEIKKNYDCDIFFPTLANNLKEVKDADVPEELQEENGIQFLYKVYENVNTVE